MNIEDSIAQFFQGENRLDSQMKVEVTGLKNSSTPDQLGSNLLSCSLTVKSTFRVGEYENLSLSYSENRYRPENEAESVYIAKSVEALLQNFDIALVKALDNFIKNKHYIKGKI